VDDFYRPIKKKEKRMDDTRDIVIKTATEMEVVKSTLSELVKAVDDLKDDLQERRGAEKLARALVGLFSGVVGAFVVKAVSWVGALPK
jgi:hypothetical protein